jgi:tubulin polyglutamylase TTLL4
VHLTNYSLNKESENFVWAAEREEVGDSKWSLRFWMRYMRQQGRDVDAMVKEMDRVITATVIAGVCEIRKTHAVTIPHRHTSHEVYGMDILFDEDLHAHLIEINVSPSFSGLDSRLDYELKIPLNLDLLRMGRIIDCDPTAKNPCPGVGMIDTACANSVSSDRIAAVEGGADPWENPVFGDFVIIRDFIEELQIPSRFRLIYPRLEVLDEFKPCFDAMRYQDIVLHRWMRMKGKRRALILERHWNVYADEMERINSQAARR